jgi:hypothetical protein
MPSVLDGESLAAVEIVRVCDEWSRVACGTEQTAGE